jgi:hypothetical protein
VEAVLDFVDENYVGTFTDDVVMWNIKLGKNSVVFASKNHFVGKLNLQTKVF